MGRVLREHVNDPDNLRIDEDANTEYGGVVFEGTFQRADEENQNERVYPSSLWESVLNDPEVQRRLENRQMLGELRHPDYRDINIKEAAFVVTDLRFAEDDKSRIIGRAETLPTPRGEILESLLRAGVKPGISSRGEGSLIEKGGTSYVSKDDYELITFDTTMEPSVEEAYPEPTNLNEALHRIAEDSDNLSEAAVELLSELAEEAGDEELSGKLEQRTDSSSHSPSESTSQMGDGNKDKLFEELSEANEKVSDLREEKASQEQTISNLKEKVGRLQSKLNKVAERFKKVRKERNQLKDAAQELQEQRDQLEERYNKAVGVIEQLTEKHEGLQEEYNEIKEYYEKSLKVLEGVQNRLEEDSVEDVIKRELGEDAIEEYADIFGDLSQMSVDEARRICKGIKERLGESASTSSGNGGLWGGIGNLEKRGDQGGNSGSGKKSLTEGNRDEDSETMKSIVSKT